MIWEQLNQPVHHPIARHIEKQLIRRPATLSLIPLTLVLWLILSLGMMLVYRAFGTIILILFPLLLVLFSSPYILLWVYRAASNIATNIDNRTLDQYGATPPGKIFVCWMIWKVVVHDGDGIGWVNILRNFIGGIITVTVFMGLCIAMNQVTLRGLIPLALLFDILFLNLLLHTDHSQSIVIAFLLTILIARNTVDRSDMFGTTTIFYIALQTGIFLVAVLITWFIFSVNGSLGAGRLLNDLQAGIWLIYGLVVALRELSVMVLWGINQRLP